MDENNRENFNEINLIGNNNNNNSKKNNHLRIHPDGYDETLDTSEFGLKAHSSPSKSGGFFNEDEKISEVSFFFNIFFQG